MTNITKTITTKTKSLTPPQPLLLLLLLLLLPPPPCLGAFVLPDPVLPSLERRGVRCGEAGGVCEHPIVNVSSCISLKVCTLTCPTRSFFPVIQTPLISWTGPDSNSSGCQLDSDTPSDAPSTAATDHGLLSVNGNTDSCNVTTTRAATTTPQGRLALALWIRPNCTNNCTVARFGESDVKVFMHGGKLCINAYCDKDALSTAGWTHLVLQANGDSLTYVVNGTPADGQNISIPVLSSSLTVTLGVSSAADLQGDDSYQLYDVRYYSDVLTFREVQQIYTNSSLSDAGELSECRCPASHPTLTPGELYSCQNEAGVKVDRLRKDFHLPNTLVDGNASSAWAGPDSGQFVLTMELENEYQVETVRVGLQRSVAGNLVLNVSSSESHALQCRSLVCSVNVSLGSQSVTPEVLASRVMRHFNLTYTHTGQQPPSPVVFTYITATGRCTCSGNAATCNTSVSPYVCDCDSGTNTEGAQCQTCAPNRYHKNVQDFACLGTCDCEEAGVSDPQRMCDQDGGACLCKVKVKGQKCQTCSQWTHSLNASDPQGCRPCSCYANGSETCSSQDGNCTCKNPVTPSLCDRCVDLFYNAGPDEGPDLCRPCGCDPRGVKWESLVCRVGTGQCTCKAYVQGRTCNECKDGYHNFQGTTVPFGCDKCMCNTVGSATPVCDKVTGNCTCQDGMTTDQLCTPQVQSFYPHHGPKIGGTILTIHGQLLGNSSQPPTVFLRNQLQNVKSHNTTTILVETEGSSDPMMDTMIVSWQNELKNLTVGNFTYLLDPVVNTNATPKVTMFLSGGCGVLFKGTNFKSVAVPRINVTDQSSGSEAFSSCRHLQSDLQCNTPDLHASGIGSGAILAFGLLLDGVKYSDLGPVTVLPDPTLDSLGSHDFQYPFETSITISGSGLTGGCNQNEVSVMIGVVSCDIVSFTQTHMECEPPKALRGSKDKPIVVKMGSHISKQVGTLNYLNIYETTYFIAIASGVGGFILLIIILCVVIYCRRRSRNRDVVQRRDLQNSRRVERMGPSNSAEPNQYTELPSASYLVKGYSNKGYEGGLDPVQQETVIRDFPKEAPLASASDADIMAKFLNRVEPSLWEAIKSATVSSSDLNKGNVCINSGKFARVIDGHFSTVRAGQQHEIKVTIKALKENLPEEKGQLPLWATAALRECLRLHRHSGDNVMGLMGLSLERDRFHIIYPYMANRTLKDNIMDSTKEFSVRQLVEYGLQVSDGLAFLSSKDLVHKDLATRNCWVNGEQVVKIADASFAWDFYKEEYVYDKARERHMPLRWMAPESLSDGYYDMRTDVWSLGVLLWELLTRGCLPFYEVKDGRVKDYILEGYQLGKPENCSDKLYELMKECWKLENEHRPHVTSLVKLLGEELTGESLEQDDIYVNLRSSTYYENQAALTSARRKAPLPPS